jgi:hypothetical protein
LPLLDDRHDLVHAVEAISAWSESWYFNAWDPVARIGFFSRLAIRPNEATLEGVFVAWLPDGGFAAIRGERPEARMADDRLEVRGIAYERVSAAREWRLRVDGSATARARTVRIRADVRFRNLAPLIGVAGDGRKHEGASAGGEATVAHGHFEQPGRWTGWIEIGDRRFDLGEARGNRDKSWGPRRWEGPPMWRWFSMNFGDEIHAGGIRIATDAGDLHRGWLWRAGELRTIRRWDVRTEVGDDGVTQRAVRIRATDKAGEVHAIDGEILAIAPFFDERSARRPGPLLLEGLTRWTLDGRTGFGISEYMHQLDAAGRVAVEIE